MKRIAAGIFRVILILGLVAPAMAQTEKLGVGDAVRVTVFQQPDLTTEARISEQGAISMPLIGQIKLAGLSATAAASHIAEAFASCVASVRRRFSTAIAPSRASTRALSVPRVRPRDSS